MLISSNLNTKRIYLILARQAKGLNNPQVTLFWWVPLVSSRHLAHYVVLKHLVMHSAQALKFWPNNVCVDFFRDQLIYRLRVKFNTQEGPQVGHKALRHVSAGSQRWA